MNLADAAGLLGVGLTILAYTGSALGKLNAAKVPALTCNLVGSSLILLSLAYDFNLSAVAMEGSWAVISLAGLMRLAFKRLRPRPQP